jgi:hypothetical protein
MRPGLPTGRGVDPDARDEVIDVYVTGGSTESYTLGRSFDFATVAYDSAAPSFVTPTAV